MVEARGAGRSECLGVLPESGRGEWEFSVIEDCWNFWVLTLVSSCRVSALRRWIVVADLSLHRGRHLLNGVQWMDRIRRCIRRRQNRSS